MKNKRIKKYIVVLLVLVVVIATGYGIVKYMEVSKQKSIAEENAYTELANLDKEFESAREVFFTASDSYIAKQITSGKYIEIVNKEPNAVSALKECDSALAKMYGILNTILSYENKLPANKFNEKTAEVKKVSELCHNTLYGYVVHHNGLIDTYNSWALGKKNDFSSLNYNMAVKTLKHFTSEICSGYIDINNDGTYEGKEETK